MKKARFNQTQIVSILKEAVASMKVADICRRHGISNAMYYQDPVDWLVQNQPVIDTLNGPSQSTPATGVLEVRGSAIAAGVW